MQKEIWDLALEIENKSDDLLRALKQQRFSPPIDAISEDMRILEVRPRHYPWGQTLEVALEWPKTRLRPGDVIRVTVVGGQAKE